MSEFSGVKLTQKGLRLQAKVQAGEPLVISKAVVGDGYLPEDQDVLTMTELVSPVDTPVNIIGNKVVGDGTTAVEVRVQNGTVPFYFREIGLIAVDPDDGEILYAYSNAGDHADFFPVGKGNLSNDVTMLTQVGNVTDLQVDVSLVVEVDREDFAAEVEERTAICNQLSQESEKSAAILDKLWYNGLNLKTNYPIVGFSKEIELKEEWDKYDDAELLDPPLRCLTLSIPKMQVRYKGVERSLDARTYEENPINGTTEIFSGNDTTVIYVTVNLDTDEKVDVSLDNVIDPAEIKIKDYIQEYVNPTTQETEVKIMYGYIEKKQADMYYPEGGVEYVRLVSDGENIKKATDETASLAAYLGVFLTKITLPPSYSSVILPDGTEALMNHWYIETQVDSDGNTKKTLTCGSLKFTDDTTGYRTDEAYIICNGQKYKCYFDYDFSALRGKEEDLTPLMNKITIFTDFDLILLAPESGASA